MYVRERRRGFALAITLIIVALVAVVTFTATSVAQLDSRSAMQDYLSTLAYYAARAGLERARDELAANYLWAGGTPTAVGGDGESYVVTVTAAPWNPTTTSGKVWQAVSTGTYQGSTRVLVAYLSPEPFSKYAYFTNQERNSAGTVINFTGNDKITGPTHTNGFYTFSGTGQFSDKVTSANYGNDALTTWDANYQVSASPAPYYVASNAAEGTTTNSSRFYRYPSAMTYATAGPVAQNITVSGSPLPAPNYSFAGGRGGVDLPVNMTELINTGTNISNPVRNTALGANNAKPYKVSYNPTTGEPDKYYRYDGPTSSDVSPRYDLPHASGQWVEVTSTQAPPVYRAVFTGTPPELKVFEKTATGTYPTGYTLRQTIDTSVKPGVKVAVDGLLQVTGESSGRTTLGTTREMHTYGNVTYKDPNTDVLGLIATQDLVFDKAHTGGSGDLTVHASLMSLKGSIRVSNHNQSTTAPSASAGTDYTGTWTVSTGQRGDINILGGLIQRTRGAVGTGSGNTIATGYRKNYVYDNKLISTPPLAFPSTGRVIVTSIIDKGALGQ